MHAAIVLVFSTERRSTTFVACAMGTVTRAMIAPVCPPELTAMMHAGSVEEIRQVARIAWEFLADRRASMRVACATDAT